MEFPPKRIHPRRSQASPAQSPAAEVAAGAAVLRKKVAVLAARHDQVKIAYHRLHSQIKIGLVEAGEVYASLAIPLTKLVGLKTKEMVSEGRFAAIILDTDFRLEMDHMDATRSSSMEIGRNGFQIGDPKNQIHSQKEESFAAKAKSAGKEILKKQQRQLIQLIQILRHIEIQVNSHQDSILQTINHHRTVLHRFLQKAIYYINTLHSQNHDTFPVTVKLLHIILKNVNEVLGSVECGLKDLMGALAEKMCKPMAKYVDNLKAEIDLGPCPQLMSIVNSMDRACADKRRDLEDTRARIRTAEEAKIKVLCRLKKTDEQFRRMKENLGFLLVSQKRPAEPTTGHRCLGIEGSQENDEKLLWELLRKKRRQQVAESPIGAKELTQSNNKHRSRPSVYHRQTRLNPQSPSCIGWIPLGSSPSVKTTTREVISSKRIKSLN